MKKTIAIFVSIILTVSLIPAAVFGATINGYQTGGISSETDAAKNARPEQNESNGNYQDGPNSRNADGKPNPGEYRGGGKHTVGGSDLMTLATIIIIAGMVIATIIVLRKKR
jgi:hypothetical protein